MKNSTADDPHGFWEIFEEAHREVSSWPDWKQQIRVGIYSYSESELAPQIKKEKQASKK
ncbi:MAG: hypothetical protein JOZ54_00700 [Acidobacteria bacterium]|nr:hypothetical protein [Acidobacteriota bacterium]MBV9925281.1 hypothetical protein [Acidobacteriota bacterium]